MTPRARDLGDRGIVATRLPESFFARDALLVAPDLLGVLICRDKVVLRITEVEAYRWPDDSACHARFGRTQRNAAMWGPAGRAYVFTCYGIHAMFNVVTNREGEAAAVLIRAAEPVAGLEEIRRRRRGLSGPSLLAGPGRLGAALGLDPSWSSHPLFDAGGVELRAGRAPDRILVGPRVGISYARPKDRRAPWRFASGDTEWVTERSTLRPRRR